MQVQPSTVTVLDVAPYNTFSLVCTAAIPTNVTAVKQFMWQRGSTDLMTGVGTNITTLNLNNATSTSVLTINATTAGSFAYTCNVTFLSSRSTATVNVVVKGSNYVKKH